MSRCRAIVGVRVALLSAYNRWRGRGVSIHCMVCAMHSIRRRRIVHGRGAARPVVKCGLQHNSSNWCYNVMIVVAVLMMYHVWCCYLYAKGRWAPSNNPLAGVLVAFPLVRIIHCWSLTKLAVGVFVYDWLVGCLIHWFIDWFIDSLIDCFIHSFIHSLIHSFIH